MRKIQIFSDILLSRYAGSLDASGRDYLQRMADSASRMQRLIHDVRAYSKVTSDYSSFSKIDLKDIVKKAMSALEVLVQETGADIQIEELPAVEADPNLLHLLFQNLLSNALKYRAAVTPVVKISSKKLKEDFQITVEDNGIGFEERYADIIFKPFKRLHSREHYEGTGIGLAICRKIVERHGGKITARSPPGRGSTFVVILPAERTRERLFREKAEKMIGLEKGNNDLAQSITEVINFLLQMIRLRTVILPGRIEKTCEEHVQIMETIETEIPKKLKR